MRFAVAAAFLGVAAAVPELAERQNTVVTTAVSTIYSCPSAVPATLCPYSTVTAAAAPLTTSVVYTTAVQTITACAATVTDCPARVVTSTIALYTTVCPVTAAAATTTVPPAPKPTTTSVYVAPVQLSYVTYTTCVPSTYVSTITVSQAPIPTVSASPIKPTNGTAILPTYTPATFRGAASSFQGSIFAAAAVALGAVLFA
jgi:chitinase